MKPWFRHYVGMTRDDKLIEAAVRSKQPLDRVVFVWCWILESASECENGGTFTVSAETIAFQLRCPPAKVRAIFDVLAGLGRIGDGRVTQWAARQYESDTSRDRMRRHRDGKKRHGDVTVTAPEAEAEAEPDTEAGKPASAGEPASKPPPPPALDLRSLEALCRHALADVDPPKGSFAPLAALSADPDRIADVLRAEVARGRKAVGSWKLWAEIVQERLAEAGTTRPAPSNAAASPPADDSPRVNTPCGPRSLAFLRAENAAGRWSKLFGPPPGQPGCVVPELALEPVP